MKILKFFLFAMLALSMGMACSEDDTSGQQPDDLRGQDLLKSKLLGEWVAPDQENSYVYAFADDDTIYIKSREGDTVSRWPYQAIAKDSIRIVRSWTTRSKVVFYSNDSIWIGDFIPSMTAVYPPIFGDAVLVRAKETSVPEENPKLTGTKWKLESFVTNGNAKAPEYDSDDRYWLIFRDDNTLKGKSSANFLGGTYEISCQTSSFRITNLEGTEIYEHPDGRFFVESLMAICSFCLQDNTLKLYYNETDYLLFTGYQEVGADCLWTPVTSITPSDWQKIRLDGAFSDSNELLRNIQRDTLFAISNQEDMGKIQPAEYHDIWIDWDNYSIIGGKIVRPHGPNEIISQQLSMCPGTSSYKYEIEVKECTLCYDAEVHLYFWAIYDKNLVSKDVLLTIKIVE